MSSVVERGNEAARRERAIRALSDASGVSLAEVRTLYMQELARLEPQATVRKYLPLLAASNVRAELRRMRRSRRPPCDGGHAPPGQE
jgi:hypothetical protein